MIFVFTGNGKGKTTSAVGMGLRTVGAGKKVLMIQFLKTKNGSAENKVIKKIKNFDIQHFGRKGFLFSRNKKSPVFEIDVQLAKKALDFCAKKLKNKGYDLIILDEINIALDLGLIDQKEILNLLKQFGKNTDIVLTGRNCQKEIIDIADLVTDFKQIKHYYQKGIKARKGIEY